MALKKKRGGLLRPPKTIKGNKRIPQSLKPQQARSLIRRFHILQKNKHSIISKLNNIFKPNLTEELNNENYKSYLAENKKKLNKLYESAYNKFELSLKESSQHIFKIDGSTKQDELIIMLGEIDSEIDKRGGLEAYQSASVQGQNNKRGGDSSKKLIELFKNPKYRLRERLTENPKALEIGCLDPRNEISTSGIFTDVVKIDLNSQEPSILKQDFMERPLPRSNDDKFDLISCSLVINFVPSPKERGEMLKRITKFLKSPTPNTVSSLFFVLPLPCVSNSRYFDKQTLTLIMESLGFKEIYYYEAKKVAYWQYIWTGEMEHLNIPKKEKYSGSTRNNFCITLD